jgi:TetR/AcrR family transcriptional repressor of nem operon
MKNSTGERLVEAARILFWKHGYSSTGIAQILKEADAGSGSLYYFFPTKEDVLLAVLEWYRENLWSQVVQPVFDRVTDPIERIFGILDAYRRGLLMTSFQHGCPIGNLALELSHSHPAAQELLAVNFTGWRKAIEQCLAEAADRLPETPDREQLAPFVLTTMEGSVMLAPPRVEPAMLRRPWPGWRNWSAAPGPIRTQSSLLRIASNGHSRTR